MTCSLNKKGIVLLEKLLLGFHVPPWPPPPFSCRSLHERRSYPRSGAIHSWIVISTVDWVPVQSSGVITPFFSCLPFQ
jgi:hypothetical protein